MNMDEEYVTSLTTEKILDLKGISKEDIPEIVARIENCTEISCGVYRSMGLCDEKCFECKLDCMLHWLKLEGYLEKTLDK